MKNHQLLSEIDACIKILKTQQTILQKEVLSHQKKHLAGDVFFGSTALGLIIWLYLQFEHLSAMQQQLKEDALSSLQHTLQDLMHSQSKKQSDLTYYKGLFDPLADMAAPYVKNSTEGYQTILNRSHFPNCLVWKDGNQTVELIRDIRPIEACDAIRKIGTHPLSYCQDAFNQACNAQVALSRIGYEKLAWLDRSIYNLNIELANTQQKISETEQAIWLQQNKTSNAEPLSINTRDAFVIGITCLFITASLISSGVSINSQVKTFRGKYSENNRLVDAIKDEPTLTRLRKLMADLNIAETEDFTIDDLLQGLNKKKRELNPNTSYFDFFQKPMALISAPTKKLVPGMTP